MERFRYIVICPDLEADHAVDQIALAGHHDYWNVRLGAQSACDLQPTLISQGQIKGYEIDIAGFNKPGEFLTCRGFADPESFRLKTIPQQDADRLFIVDDDNMIWLGVHERIRPIKVEVSATTITRHKLPQTDTAAANAGDLRSAT